MDQEKNKEEEQKQVKTVTGTELEARTGAETGAMIETEKVIATGTGICRNRSKDWKSDMNRKRNRKRSKKVTETTRGQEQEQRGQS